jgi:hypothetical protein
MAKVLQKALANFLEHRESHEIPSCFTIKEYREWSALEDELPTLPVRKFVCRDCTASHQAMMTKSHRCFNSTIDLSKIAD